MSVYYFDLTTTTINDNLRGVMALNMNKFWSSDNSTANAAYNTLINYVIFNNNTTYETDGEYSFGQIYIQPKSDPAQGRNGYPPNIIINQQKNNGINIDTVWDANGNSYIYIREIKSGTYGMKCTVI